jgi:hypothetical protein
MILQIYQAAARAGLLTPVRWITGKSNKGLDVEWRETDETMLHDLVVGTSITMTGPTVELAEIQQGELITSGKRRYRVRDVRQIHDGSETRATLSIV